MSVGLERKPLGQVLVSKGILAPERLEAALESQRETGHTKLLGEILVEMKDCTEEQVSEALAMSFGLPFAKVSPEVADPAVASILPQDFIRSNEVLPLFQVNDVLTMAMADPANVFLVEEVARRTGKKVQVVAAMPADILNTIDRPTAETPAPPMPVKVAESIVVVEPATVAIATTSAEDPAAAFVAECMKTVLVESAGDVHFEPGPDFFRVRMRFDGRLVERFRPALNLHAPIVARLKLIAGLNAAEQGLPQEGVGQVTVENRTVEARVHTMPGKFGEKVVVRLADSERVSLNLEKLGFSYEMLKQWTKLIARPQGLILVAGPAGSGKSSTLATTLQSRTADDLNVCALEETLAQSIPGVNSFQLNREAGQTLPAALRAMLRQEPDVLLVSELNDLETAQLAVDAARRGKLVFAAVNTIDAVSAIPHLLQLGVEPYALASTLAGVLSQRLVRRLCQSCKTLCAPDANELRQFDPTNAPTGSFFGPKGCDRCRNIGYAGRLGIFELLATNDMLVEAVTRRASITELRTIAQQSGLQSLRTDGLEKVKAGITSLTELLRVT